MKKAEIFARVLNKWPEGAYKLDNFQNGEIVVVEPRSCPLVVVGYMDSVIHDDFGSVVTREQWESERARIASNQQATQDAREIVQGESKRSKEDQALWDRVAIASVPALIANPSEWSGDDEAGGDIRSYEDAAKAAAFMADAFMVERAKRLRNSHTTSSTT